MKKFSFYLMFFAMLILLTGCYDKYDDKEKAQREFNNDYNNYISQGYSDKEAKDLLARDEAYIKWGLVPDPKAQNTNTNSSSATNDNATTDGTILKMEETPEEIFLIGNGMAVYNGGTSPTVTISKDYNLTELWTYHWNEEKGKEPGTIALKDENGKIYGPWPTTGSPGQGGVPNAYWKATPNIDIPAGKYTVIDSDPATWAQNEDCGGLGMTWAKGFPKD